MKKFLFAVIAVLLTAQTAFAADPLPAQIITSKGPLGLALELAITPATREHGLMDRKDLGRTDGMLFIFPTIARRAFWMKNTILPLDMLFVDAQGTIVRIAPNTKPFSLEEIDSGKPVLAVIELGAGRAASSSIAVGDKVHYALPKNTHVE